MEIQVRYSALLLLFSVMTFWMESLHKNIQLMLEFLKAPLLVLHFSYYTLMTFLTMLSVILLSVLMMLLSILSVISHHICGNNVNWLLNLNLIYETLDGGKKWLIVFNTAKSQLVMTGLLRQFFLIFCKNIMDFIFWVIWKCLASCIKKDIA